LFLSTSKDQPIHCWNPNGILQASFRGINSADELSHAYSIAVSLDGKTIFAGYRNFVRLFDFSNPGRQIFELKTFEKNGIGSGQKGMLSTITACPTFHGVYAVGSYSGTVGLYSTQTNLCDCLFGTSNCGITHMQYSSDGNFLYVGYRKNSLMQSFDLRMPGKVLANYYRPATTNQRVYFQVDPYDRYLYSGTSAGNILIFDLKREALALEPLESVGQSENAILPDWQIRASSASVPGLSLHPSEQILAVTTGQRVFPHPLSPDVSDDDDDVINANATQESKKSNGYSECMNQSELDNSLQLFRLAK